jgi:hypothetical protein
MDKDEEYLLGFILGDGMVKHYPNKGYEVKITEKNLEHAKYLSILIEKLYRIKPKLVKDKHRSAWRIRVYRKAFYQVIKQRIQDLMMDPRPNKYLIGGLFDAEGDYTASKNRIRFTNKDYVLVNLVMNYLDKNNINYHLYVRRKNTFKWYVVEIYGRENILKLVRKIDLRHPKWNKMKAYI